MAPGQPLGQPDEARLGSGGGTGGLFRLGGTWVANLLVESHMIVGQSQWYHFGVGAQPILVFVSGDWDVHWGYGVDP